MTIFNVYIVITLGKWEVNKIQSNLLAGYLHWNGTITHTQHACSTIPHHTHISLKNEQNGNQESPSVPTWGL